MSEGYGKNEMANDLCRRIKTAEALRAGTMEREDLRNALALDHGTAEKDLVTG